jgi:hypothetical protein
MLKQRGQLRVHRCPSSADGGWSFPVAFAVDYLTPSPRAVRGLASGYAAAAKRSEPNWQDEAAARADLNALAYDLFRNTLVVDTPGNAGRYREIVPSQGASCPTILALSDCSKLSNNGERGLNGSSAPPIERMDALFGTAEEDTSALETDIALANQYALTKAALEILSAKLEESKKALKELIAKKGAAIKADKAAALTEK